MPPRAPIRPVPACRRPPGGSRSARAPARGRRRPGARGRVRGRDLGGRRRTGARHGRYGERWAGAGRARPHGRGGRDDRERRAGVRLRIGEAGARPGGTEEGDAWTTAASGIDPGTTRSRVACVDDVGRPTAARHREGTGTTPSAVFFETPDKVIVGATAKDGTALEPDVVTGRIRRAPGPAVTRTIGVPGRAVGGDVLRRPAPPLCRDGRIPGRVASRGPRRCGGRPDRRRGSGSEGRAQVQRSGLRFSAG